MLAYFANGYMTQSQWPVHIPPTYFTLMSLNSLYTQLWWKVGTSWSYTSSIHHQWSIWSLWGWFVEIGTEIESTVTKYSWRCMIPTFDIPHSCYKHSMNCWTLTFLKRKNMAWSFFKLCPIPWSSVHNILTGVVMKIWPTNMKFLW